MVGGSSYALRRDIETLFDAGTLAGWTDRQLLERFALRRDAAAEAAFEVLVRRHEPMVWRVCRNVLADPNDAQDAFQATFLVLVRRSGSVRRLESLGGWLHGVACRVAARARVEAARRRAVEGRAALRVVEAVESTAGDAIDSRELGPIVQEAVRRLPEKYRAVVVLCYWEGLTQEQAAAQLGCPLGTVRSRLARARALLHRRLTRRGLAPLAAATAAGLDSASAGVSRLPSASPELVQVTIQAASRVAAGPAASPPVSAVVASLVEHVVWRVAMIKISSVAVGVALIGLAGYGTGIAAQQSRGSRSVGLAAQGSGEPASSGGQPAQTQPERTRLGADPKASDPRGRATILSPVEGQTVILAIHPEGTVVKKGEVVCELDSAALRDQLVNQRITVQSAEANFQNAKLTRETAEIAVIEYKEGIYPSDLADVEGDIKLAEAETSLAEAELGAAGAKLDGAERRLAIMRAEVGKLRARIALEKAQTRRKVLVEYTKGKTIKVLETEVEKARSHELSRQATWELEKTKEQNLERQIRNCTIVAPSGGTIQLATDRAPFGGGLVTVGAGATVRGGQLLLQIIPNDPATPRKR